MDKRVLCNRLLEYSAPLEDWSIYERTLQFVMDSQNPFDKEDLDGHLTASAIIFNRPLTKVHLVYNEKVGGFIQPGGHAETDEQDPLAVAWREVHEETGLAVQLYPKIIDVNIHQISHGSARAHPHYDILFYGICAEQTPIIPPPADTLWARIAEIQNYSTDKTLQKSLRRALVIHSQRVLSQ